jgi:predicted  nucleic acid-binding Zn-ribbon protein
LTELQWLTTITLDMGLPGQLYRLQQLDQELERQQKIIKDIDEQLGGNEALSEAQSELASQELRLAEVAGRQKTVEWELEDLQEKTKHLSNRLYGGTIKNPKELVNLEQEVKDLRNKLSNKEDELLDLMTQAETIQGRVEASAEELEGLTEEWREEQAKLKQRKVDAESRVAKLSPSRQELAQQIDDEALKLYEQIRATKAQPVAKVEQGRCQGCRITLPTGLWQRAKAGDLVQCGSCTRILYLE